MEFSTTPKNIRFECSEIFVSPGTEVIDPNIGKRLQHPVVYFMFDYLSKIKREDLASTHNINFLMNLVMAINLTSRPTTRLFNIRSLSYQSVPNLFVGNRKLNTLMGSQFVSRIFGVMSPQTFWQLGEIDKMGELVSAVRAFSFNNLENRYFYTKELMEGTLAGNEEISVADVVEGLENMDAVVRDVGGVADTLINAEVAPSPLNLMVLGNPTAVKNEATGEITAYLDVAYLDAKTVDDYKRGCKSIDCLIKELKARKLLESLSPGIKNQFGKLHR